MPDYTIEETWKLYEKLPQALKDAIFSEEVADNINKICTKSKLTNEQMSEVAKYTGQVMLGLVPLDGFEATLKKEVKLTPSKASRVAWEIDRFIFGDIRECLTALHQVKPAAKAQKEPKKSSYKQDPYLEPVD